MYVFIYIMQRALYKYVVYKYENIVIESFSYQDSFGTVT